MATLKQTVRTLIPESLLQPLQNYRYRKEQAQYRDLSTKDIFTKIYRDGAWRNSADSAQVLFSGSGSHVAGLVEPYVAALKKFLSSLSQRPDVVDLGCGDFFVGSQIRSYCNRYVAGDIVEPVIRANAEKYQALDVDFRVIDLTKDELPAGDIVFVRQVLQHLSNDAIAAALPRLVSAYRHLVLTEHLPKTGSFKPNIDKRTGPDIRLGFNSGVVLTEAPFNLKPREETCLCEVEENGGVIRTMLYRLR
jgi:SAM-dependent methyltransferase